MVLVYQTYGPLPALYNQTAGMIVNGTCNWWGAVNGPSGAGSGSGDEVSEDVIYQPWLTSEAPSDCDGEGPLARDITPSTVAINTQFTIAAVVDDTNFGGTVIASAEYQLDDGSWTAMSAADNAFYDEVVEEVEASHAGYAETGIHKICVRGTDAAGNTGIEECSLLAVYDPDGGFVTGGGWIDSPAGAYMTPTQMLVWDQDFSLDDSGWRDDDDGWYGDISVAGGTAMFYGDGTSAPFSRFDGYRDVWPGTWTAEIDVYLDPHGHRDRASTIRSQPPDRMETISVTTSSTLALLKTMVNYWACLAREREQ
jgi:hypothetical protein